MLFGTKIKEFKDEQGLLHEDENEMLKLWLADKVIEVADGEKEISNQNRSFLDFIP